MQHLAHAVEMQPITMSTKHDRMQYEMPATSAAHAQHEQHQQHGPQEVTNGSAQTQDRGSASVQVAADHGGHAMSRTSGSSPEPMDHSAHMEHGSMGGEMSGIGGTGGMDHDMSDPSMAAPMERDMRNKLCKTRVDLTL
jgi:hypothetical protein